MPIYQYQCQECSAVSEFLRSSSPGDSTLACEGCGGHNLERIISAPILLKDRGHPPGTTCCGREERCEKPPCSTDKGCHRH